ADFHVVAIELAAQPLVCLIGKVEVFSRNVELTTGDLQPYLMGGLIGKDDHPAQRVEERVPVEGQFIGVHLWDNSLVIGIALVDQPTDEVDIGKLKKCVCAIVFHRDGGIFDGQR